MKYTDEMNPSVAVRRCLFGRPCGIQNLSELIALRKIEEERSTVEWDFDFRSGCPVMDGSTRTTRFRHEWTLISAEDEDCIPEVYKHQAKRFQVMFGGGAVEATVERDVGLPRGGKISKASSSGVERRRTKRSHTLREKVLKNMMKLSKVDEGKQKTKRVETAVVREISKLKKDVCKYSKFRTSSYCKKIMSCSTPTKIRKTRLQQRTVTAPVRRMSEYFMSKKPSPCIDRKNHWQCTRHPRQRL